MLDFDVASPARRCATTQREFAPGEAIVSYLVREGTEIVRRDVGPEIWQGPPEGCVAWWRSRIPHPAAKKFVWSPDEEALSHLDDLAGPEQRAERFVLALALARKRLLRFVRTDTDEAGIETMIYVSSIDESEYAVTVVDPTPEEISEIQRSLAERLAIGTAGNDASASDATAADAKTGDAAQAPDDESESRSEAP